MLRVMQMALVTEWVKKDEKVRAGSQGPVELNYACTTIARTNWIYILYVSVYSLTMTNIVFY